MFPSPTALPDAARTKPMEPVKLLLFLLFIIHPLLFFSRQCAESPHIRTGKQGFSGTVHQPDGGYREVFDPVYTLQEITHIQDYNIWSTVLENLNFFLFILDKATLVTHNESDTCVAKEKR